MIHTVIRIECDKCGEQVFEATTPSVKDARKEAKERDWHYCRWQGRSSDLCPACYAEWEKGGRL